jgi:integrase/recombinase XerD
MENPQSVHLTLSKKLPEFVIDKFIPASHQSSLTHWCKTYYQLLVSGSPLTTQKAKHKDIEKFLNLFMNNVGYDCIHYWTPAVSKHFQKFLQEAPSPTANQPLRSTSINRILATLRHMAHWIIKHSADQAHTPFPAGNPFFGVKDLVTDAPDWNGLTTKQLMRLKAACEIRLTSCKRTNQNPLIEVAVFYCLLMTGLRESELVSLNVGDYHHGGFHQVKRKGSKISRKVPLPAEAAEKLDQYLASRSNLEPHHPLFLGFSGGRLQTLAVYRICLRIAQLANAYSSTEEKFHLTPHMLRHTFLKKVADKHGVHVAQDMSGNVSIQEIFRYTKPSQEEKDKTAQELF